MFSQVSVCPEGWASLVPCPFQEVGISDTMSLPEGGYVGGNPGVGMSRGWYPPSNMGPQGGMWRGWVCGGGGYEIPKDTIGKQAVCILLECFLVNSVSVADYLFRRWMGVFLEEAFSGL